MTSPSNEPTSVSTRRAAGSIATAVAYTKRTPGFTMSRYGCCTAGAVVRPNITSSFENPKTNASDRSIRVTSTSSPSVSDSRVDSSSPPKPAPRTSTRMAAFSGDAPPANKCGTEPTAPTRRTPVCGSNTHAGRGAGARRADMTDVDSRTDGIARDQSRDERPIVARHPQRGAVLGAEALSATGDAVFWVGLLVWLLGRPDGTGLIAVAAVARLAPRVVFGAAGGVIADRYDRRRLLVVLDAVRSGLMIALAFLVAREASALVVLAGVFAIYVLAAPYRPAMSAGIPVVVGERDAAAANALDGSVRQVATFLGPLLGTAALWLGDPSWAFAVNSVTFALSALLLARVSRLRGRPPAARMRHLGGSRSWWTALRGGIDAVTEQPGLALTMWLVFVFSVARGFELVLLVFVADERLNMGAEGVGILSAAIGVGALCAVPLVRQITNVRRPAAAIVVSLLLTSVPLALLGV